MQAAPARYVSVSELYAADEVELLLDEIRDLEPTSCRGEDVQDFEIAGSGCGAGGGGGGGRSPAGTELTERSWDSHAQYRRAPPARARPLAPLYWRPRHLLTARGAAGALVLLCAAGAAAGVWAGAGLRVGRMPHAARLQLLLLAALTSALLHAALLLLHVTRLAALLPLDWHRLGAWSHLWSCVSLGAGGALTLAALAAAPYRGAGEAVRAPLLAAAALALAGAAAGGGVAGASLASAAARRLRAPAYRAVPLAPPPGPPGPPACASTSRDDPL